MDHPRATVLGQATSAIAAIKDHPHLRPGTRAAPALKIATYRTTWGQIVGQHAPLTARELLIQQCIDYFAQIDGAARARALLGNIDQQADALPLLIAKIGFVDRSLHVDY